MRICYVYASRSRTQRFFEGLDNICAMSHSQDYFVVAKLDDDDTYMNNEEVRQRLATYSEVIVKWGHSRSKIHAINRDICNLPPFDILINFSDDMRFILKGFDDIIRYEFKKHFPDLDGFIHFPDQYAKDRISTMSIMGRKYFERFGYIYHESYYSLFCDDEETLKAKLLGKYRFIPIQLFEHRHYATGHTQKDALYHRNDTYAQDKQVFEARKAKNFDLNLKEILT